MIPGLYTYVATGLAGLAIGFAGGWNVQGWRMGDDLSKLQAQFSEAVSISEKTARLQSEKYRAIEQEMSHVQVKAETEASALRIDLDRARAAGGVSAVGLRNAAAAAATASRIDCQADATAELRQTAANAERVRADVLSELEQRTRLLGTTADERGIAGSACETIHENAVKLTDGGR